MIGSLPGDLIQEATVYGVSVNNMEGRAGMVSIVLGPGADPEAILPKLFTHCSQNLPSYAQPHFVRFQTGIELTGTFKHRKLTLVPRRPFQTTHK